MKTILASWQEKDGRPALAVQFPRMFPFQIEEVELLARDLGFGVEGLGRWRALGDDTGVWTIPGPGAVVSNLYAVHALRTALEKLGYMFEVPALPSDDDGVPDWLKYETAEMGLPAFDSSAYRDVEIGRRKGIIAIEGMIKSLGAVDLDEDQQKAFAEGQELYRDGRVSEAYQLLRDLGRPIWRSLFEDTLEASSDAIVSFNSQHHRVVYDDDEDWKRKFDAGYTRLRAMIDMPDRRAQFLVKHVMKYGCIPAEHRERYSELTDEQLSQLVVGVFEALLAESTIIGREQIDAGEFEDIDDVLADLDRIVAGEPAVIPKVIVATWQKEPVGALRMSFPLSLSEAERPLVERLGTIFGFAADGDVWIAPEGGEGIVAWRNELAAAGIEVEFRDSPELIRASLKPLPLKSLDAEKVAPFEVDFSGFSEAEKSEIKKVAWFCRFGFDGNILSPPDMNESYLMFRNKMREAGFLIRIVREDEK